MNSDRGDGKPKQESIAGGGLAAIGLGAFGVVCCVGFPLMAGALASGVALGAVLGVGAGVIVAAVLVGLVVVRSQRRRACEVPDTPGSSPTRRPDASEVS